MDLRKTIVMLALVAFLVMPVQAALNGTFIGLIITEAFIILNVLLNEVVDIIPTIIEVGIMFAVLTMILGFFGLILLAFRRGIMGGIKL